AMPRIAHRLLICLLFVGYSDDVAAALTISSVAGDGIAITADVMAPKCLSQRVQSTLPTVILPRANQPSCTFPSSPSSQGPEPLILRATDPLFAYMSLLC